MLKPEDLKNKKFNKSMRGYDPAEVDKFLDEVRQEFVYLYLDNTNMKETLERVTGKLEYYQQMENTMQSALTVAQETADEVKTNSEKQADLLHKETLAKCQQSIISAQNEAQRLVDEATEKASELYSQIKVRTDNLKRTVEMECQQMRDDADAYVVDLRTTVEKETAALKATTEEVCKKTSERTLEETQKMLQTARTEAHEMLMEANGSYRTIIADAEERSRKMVFEAETRATAAKNEYENIVKKYDAFKKNITNMLQTQLGVLENFTSRKENEGKEEKK